MKNKSNSPTKEKFKLKLTKPQLEHLRDLLGVLLPPDTKTTVSEALASSENRQADEIMLWEKVKRACEKAGVSVGDNAPDFVVTLESHPTLAVYKMSEEDGDEDDEGCCGGSCKQSCDEVNSMFKSSDGE
jgi:hypothetical protein